MQHRLIATVCAALLAGAFSAPARAADPAPGEPDDAAALELADDPGAAPPEAKTWRLYLEAAGARSRLHGEPSHADTARGSLDLRIDTTLAPGLRGVLSDRFDYLRRDSAPREHKVNALREAYVSWQARPDLVLDLGRVNLRHGAAWGYNPTDFFKAGALRSIVSPDPASLRENRMGTVLVQAQTLWSGGSLSAALSPRLARRPSDATFSLDLGSTNPRNRWLLAASHRLG